jgi:molybdopterin molybdotransferase
VTGFDRVIAVDWSARSVPSPLRPVRDAIFVCEGRVGRIGPATYHRTRTAAMAAIGDSIAAALAAGERVLAGFDFAFGYPRGFAAGLTGRDEGLAVWDWLAAHVVDRADNANNRWDVAAAINARFPGIGPLWGCPPGLARAGLPARGRDRAGHGLPDRRATDLALPGAQSPFKLFTAGSVGSQSLLGLPRLSDLRRRFGQAVEVWPLQSGFRAPRAPVVLVEIWPTLALRAPGPDGGGAETIPDARQVRATVAAIVSGALMPRGPGAAFGPPPGLADADRVAREEGWIFGATAAK